MRNNSKLGRPDVSILDKVDHPGLDAEGFIDLIDNAQATPASLARFRRREGGSAREKSEKDPGNPGTRPTHLTSDYN
jgi:hypothetical protein